MGRVRLVTAIASLAGVGVYNACLKHVALKKIFFWSTIVGTLLGLTQVSPPSRALFLKLLKLRTS